MSDSWKDLLHNAKETITADQDAIKDQMDTMDEPKAKLWSNVQDFFGSLTGNMWKGFEAVFGPGINEVSSFIGSVMTGEAAIDTTEWAEQIVTLFGMDTNDATNLKKMLDATKGASPIVGLAIVVGLIMEYLKNISTVMFGTAYKRMMADFSPSVPDSNSIIRAGFIAPELKDRVRKAMAENGLSDKDIDLMIVSQYATFNQEYIRAMMHRGALDPAQADVRLAELGFTPDRREELKKIWPVLPSVADMVTMMAKEAFEPNMISKYGLGAEYPEELNASLKLHGMDPEWSARYWSAHWVHPSYQQIMEAFHRNEIKYNDVYEWFKLVEIPPYWRKVLTQIAYHPYTRVDVRRMHLINVIEPEDLPKAYTDLGYDAEKASKMTEFTIRYNSRDNKDLSKIDILKGYEDRDLDFTLAAKLLQDIGYTETTAGYLLSRIDLDMDRSLRLEQAELLKEKYLANLITDSEVKNSLLHIGFTTQRTNELQARWQILRVKNAKLPSKTDLDKFLKHKIIGDRTYKIEMAGLGYSPKYIDWYYKLATSGG